MTAFKKDTSKVYNVIVLDKSGSMSSIARQAVDGVNETLGSIRSSKRSNPDIEQFVTLVLFCGCEYVVVYDNVPIDDAHDIKNADYQPCCSTPLYDAMGKTINTVSSFTAGDRRAFVMVTVVTDGYENSSHEFSSKALKALIDSRKEEGWLFAYIGADHDVEAVATSLSIDNAIAFDKSPIGVGRMFSRLGRARKLWNDKVQSVDCCCSIDKEDFDIVEAKKKISKDFFK